ncbi:MAG: SPASM domain-containing protein [Flavobacteriales bacterium]|nr:SPASM domain-containing protein [Flavobacteriales bacterium]
MSVTSKILDRLNIAGKLTPKRLANAGRVYTSFYKSRMLGSTYHPAFPLGLAIEPTTACNLRCPECPSGLRSFTRPTGRLSMPLVKRVLDEVSPYTFYLTLYFQGEPYLNPDFLDIVEYARSKSMYTATSTNGHFLNDENARRTVESGLDRLIISLDGTTQETYEAYRKEGQLDKVLAGAERIVYWKKKLKSRTPYTVFQFLVVKPNEHQIPEARDLTTRLGLDGLLLKTAQVYDFKHGHELIPDQEQFARYKKMPDGTYTIKNSLDNHCWKLWTSCVVTWDGKVVPCCFDKDASHEMGNLNERSFREVWNNEAYRAFRSQLLKSRSTIDICNNCSEGTKVWG